MLAQDEILERLNIGFLLPVTLLPRQLIKRSSKNVSILIVLCCRFNVCGRVRLTSVDGASHEHARADVGSRFALKRRILQ